MKLETFQYIKDKGWSVKNFPQMDSEQTLILAFASPGMIENPDIFKELATHYPKSKIIGCSTAGEISGSSIMDDSICVAVAQFENTPLKIAIAEIQKLEDPIKTGIKAGEKIAKDLKKPDLRSILVLSNGLKVNGTELVKGLSTLGMEDVVITGGLAGDGDRFKETWILCDDKIYKNHVVAVGLYGESVHVGFSSRGGWDIFGPERFITRSKGNVLYELDGKPALELYKQYLGERAEGLPSTGLLFPLSIRKDEQDQKHLVRTILSVDEDAQSLTFAGDVPLNYLAQLMRSNFDRLIASAGEAAEDATEKMQKHNGPILAVAISCVGRRLLMGERTEEETEALIDTFPADTKQIGFYSYGELSPVVAGTCDLHNQTMTLTTIYET